MVFREVKNRFPRPCRVQVLKLLLNCFKAEKEPSFHQENGIKNPKKQRDLRQIENVENTIEKSLENAEKTRICAIFPFIAKNNIFFRKNNAENP